MNLQPELIHLIGAYLDLPNFDKQLLSIIFYNCLNDEWFWKKMATKINCDTLNLNIMKKIFIQKPQEIEKKYEFNQTLLHLACSHNNFDLVKYLIEYGLDINIECKYNQTPLYTACNYTTNFEMIEYLIIKGSKINSLDKFGNTPLHAACWNGNLKICKYLVEHGANIKIINDYGKTPLYNACMHGHYKLSKYLIAQGADENIDIHNKSKCLIN